MAQLIRCPHCNKFIDKDSNICPKCSQPLTDKKPAQEKQEQQREQPKIQKAIPKPEPVQAANEPNVIDSNIVSEAPVYKPYNSEPQPEVVEQPEDIEINESEEPVYEEPELAPEPQPERSTRKTPEPEPVVDEEENEEPEEEQISTDKEMEAFYASMNQNKTNKADKKKEEKSSDDETKGKKLAGFAGNFASNIVNNSKAIIGKGKPAKDDEPEEEMQEEAEDTSPRAAFTRERARNISTDSQKKAYNANADGYYDYVTAEIDARTEHVTTEMVIKTISFIAIVIVVVVGMINFI